MSFGNWSGDRRAMGDEPSNRPPDGVRQALAMIVADVRPALAKAVRRRWALVRLLASGVRARRFSTRDAVRWYRRMEK